LFEHKGLEPMHGLAQVLVLAHRPERSIDGSLGAIAPIAVTAVQRSP
jgi:hypothetical protein